MSMRDTINQASYLVITARARAAAAIQVRRPGAWVSGKSIAYPTRTRNEARVSAVAQPLTTMSIKLNEKKPVAARATMGPRLRDTRKTTNAVRLESATFTDFSASMDRRPPSSRTPAAKKWYRGSQFPCVIIECRSQYWPVETRFAEIHQF